jgi:hypothetical protein
MRLIVEATRGMILGLLLVASLPTSPARAVTCGSHPGLQVFQNAGPGGHRGVATSGPGAGGMYVGSAHTDCLRVWSLMIENTMPNNDDFVEAGWFKSTGVVSFPVPCAGNNGNGPTLFSASKIMDNMICTAAQDLAGYRGQYARFKIDNPSALICYTMLFEGVSYGTQCIPGTTTGWPIAQEDRITPDTGFSYWDRLFYQTGTGFHQWNSSSLKFDADPTFNAYRVGASASAGWKADDAP